MTPRLTAEERREAILVAAIPLFAERGYESVTTKEIAKAAEVSEALLYRHFEGKKGIFDAIECACVAEASEPAHRFRDLDESTETLVILIFALMWKIQEGPEASREHHRRMQRLVWRSLFADGALAADFLARTSRPWVEKMRSCLRAAIEAGDIEMDPEEAELGIWLGHHLSCAIALYGLSGREIVSYPGGSERLVTRSVEFCLRGIGMTTEAIRRTYDPDQLLRLMNS